MTKINRAVFRDIFHHKSRSLITLSTIILIIALPLSMFSTTPSITNSIDANSEKYHLSHLNLLFSPTTADAIDIIEDTSINFLGYKPERIISRVSSKLKLIQNDNWYLTNAIGINTSKVHSINQIKLIEGTLEIGANEVIILDTFATYLNLSLNEQISLQNNNSLKTYTIKGIVKSIEFLSYDFSREGVIYLEENILREILNIPIPLINNILIYFTESITPTQIEECSLKIRDNLLDNSIPLRLIWHEREISKSAALQDALELTSKYMNSAAIIIIIISGFVIYIITKRYAFEQRKQTGTLYSFGFSPHKIMKAFLLRTLILTIVGIVLGVLGGWFLLKIFTETLSTKWGIIELNFSFSMMILLEIVFLTTFISLSFTYFAAKENVSMTPYEAIRGKPKEYTAKASHKTKTKKTPLFLKYAFRNLSRNKKRTLFTQIALLGSLLLSFSLISAQSSVRETQDKFFNSQIQWDIRSDFVDFDLYSNIYDSFSENTSINSAEPYCETIVTPTKDSKLLMFLEAIIFNSELSPIDLQEGQYFSGNQSNEVIVSQYIAKRLNYSIGEDISFWFNSIKINVSIVGISRDIGNPVSIYMPLLALQNDLGFNPVNGFVATMNNNSNTAEFIQYLNLNNTIKSAIFNTQYLSGIDNMIKLQTTIINIMVILSFSVTFLIFFSTTFIIILERKREISLERVFGFSNSQIIIQLLTEMILLMILPLFSSYLAGYLLHLYWISIITETYFTVDPYILVQNIMMIITFAIIIMGISLFPEYRALRRRKLGPSLAEEN